MTYLILQTALIMLAAYIAGALIGCMARRMIYGGPGPNLETETSTSLVDGDLDRPMIETNDGSAAREREKLEAERFARVLTQAPDAAPQDSSQLGEPVAASSLASEPVAEPEPVRVQPSRPEPEREPVPNDNGEAYRQVSTAAAAAAAIAAASAAVTSGGGAVVAEGPAEDLTLIRGIDASTSDALAGLGITRFEQIASWRADDVQAVGASVGSPARPARENWIEQAKILAGGGQTAFSRSRSGVEEFNLWQWVAATGATVTPTYPPAKSEAPKPVKNLGIDAASPRARQSVYGAGVAGKDSSQSSLADEGKASEGLAVIAAAAAAAGAAGVAATLSSDGGSDDESTIAVLPPVREPAPETEAAAPVGSGDDLTRIKGVDKVTQDQLVAQGVTAFVQLANWKADDVARFEDGAAGVGHGRVGRENWIEQAQILASGGETQYSRGKAKGYEIAQAVEPVARDEPASKADAGVQPTPSQDQDGAAQDGADSIAAATAAAAAAAAATAAGVAASATAEPAEEPAGNEAAAEPAVRPARLADAIKARQGGGSESQKTGLAGLRSVRSQALRGEVGAAGSFDDLKRIRGIGVLIEKKLNSLGITSFEQIANWSNSEIDRLSQVLDFKGRIERENWVEQARILASGGHTEFSRRLDQDRS